MALLDADGSLDWLNRSAAASPVARRMNDGVCAPAGRFWATCMAWDATPGAGALFRVGPDGSVVPVLDGLTIPNGPALTADGRRMYLADSAADDPIRLTITVVTASGRQRRLISDRATAASGGPERNPITPAGSVNEPGGRTIKNGRPAAASAGVRGSHEEPGPMTDSRPASPGHTIGVLVVAVLMVLLGAGPAHAAGSPAAGMGAAVNGTDAATVAFQDRLNSALQKMVDAVAGPGRAVVTTTAELDLDQVEATTTTYTQDPSVGALAEKLSRTSYTDNAGGTRYESTSAVRVNALNVLRETRRDAPGRVKRLNIAVLIDAVPGRAVDLAQLRNLVSVAAGVDARRGDVVAVAAMPMKPPMTATADGTPVEPATASAAGRWLPAGAALSLLIVFLLLAGRWRVRAARTSVRHDDTPRIRATLHGRQPAVAIAALPQTRRDSPPRQREISRFAGDDPEQAAAVLREWTGR